MSKAMNRFSPCCRGILSALDETGEGMPRGSKRGGWIRRPFLDWQGGWGPERQWLVVHGHTPAVRRLGAASRFLALANRKRTHGRICLDAGAAFGLPQVGWAEFRAGQFRLALSRAI